MSHTSIESDGIYVNGVRVWKNPTPGIFAGKTVSATSEEVVVDGVLVWSSKYGPKILDNRLSMVSGPPAFATICGFLRALWYAFISMIFPNNKLHPWLRVCVKWVATFFLAYLFVGGPGLWIATIWLCCEIIQAVG
jgi:hypothetical protein